MDSVNDYLNVIDEFLTPMRDRMTKEAAADNSVSFKDTDPNKIENQEKPSGGPNDGNTSYTSLGSEQTGDANDGGSNVGGIADNTDSDGKSPVDDQGPKTLDTDEKVVDKGNLGARRSQEITQEQKMARATGLANRIVESISSTLAQKQAAEEAQSQGQMQYADDTHSKPKTSDSGEFGDEFASNMASDYEKEASAALQKCASIAQVKAEEFYEACMLGMLKRAQDEAELANSGLDPRLIEAAGGVGAILDKVAMEYPEAVMPEEVMAAGGAEGGMELPPEGGAPEAGPEGGAEGLDELAAALEEAGVTPEELEEAFADVQALQEAGVTPDELSAALEESVGGAAPEAEAEAIAPEEKLASDNLFRQRVEAVKYFLAN
jgi:hypothetical protein